MNAQVARVNHAGRLGEVMTELNAQFFERRSAVEALMLGMLSGQHVFMLGQPGTGKTLLANEFAHRFVGARTFKMILSKTRSDQALLGPYDLPLLRERGEFRRRIAGYLLDVDLAILDEIGKMSPTTGHEMLAALNERVRHEVADDNSEHPIPLHMAITASNEIPVGESDDMAALWDRLLIRVVVDSIREPGNFAALLTSAVSRGPASLPTTIAWAQVRDTAVNVVPRIKIPTAAIDAVLTLKGELAGHGIRVSDRRWQQSMRVLQASAYLNGRAAVSVDDIGVLRYCLWEQPDQIRTVERAALKVANPLNEECMVVMDTINDIRAELVARRGKSLAERAGYGSEALAKLKTAEKEVTKIRKRCADGGLSTTRADEVADEITATRRTVMIECLDTDPGAI